MRGALFSTLMTNGNYEPVMGLEIHARINTESKMFCGCSNDTWKAGPNEHICPVCAGFPGSLPVLNKKAVEYGMLTALALKCTISPQSKFDRKSYFYPDLPCGYQISQYDEPLAHDGMVTVFVDGEKKSFHLRRLHLENDAGKLIHENGKSLVDLNRAGSPLMEIVTEPDFHTPKEVSAFLKEVQRMLRFLGAADADMEKGMFRCDVNVSVKKKTDTELGTKVEVKNMNSFRNIEKALEYEIERQIGALGKGEAIVQETRGWDDVKGITISQRNKEEAMDYRYFPEPDIPPLSFTGEDIESIRKKIPELPSEKMERYHRDYDISYTDAEILVSSKESTDFFEVASKESADPKKTANWIISEIYAYLNESGKAIDGLPYTPYDLAELVKLINSGEISGKIAKEILLEMNRIGGSPKAIMENLGLKQMSDQGEIERICREVIDENKALIDEYRSGKVKIFGAFVGQVMKKTGGKANPQVVNEALKKLLAAK